MNHNAVKNALLTFIAALVILCTTGNTIFAENMVLGIIPDGIYPVAQKNISLVSEEVTVSLTGDELATVSCRYDFKNTRSRLSWQFCKVNEKPSGLLRKSKY